MADTPLAPRAAPAPLATAQATGVTAWLLAGGEGRRMQGRDKGLQPWRGQALAAWVLARLAPPQAIGITANRHADSYRALLGRCPLVAQQGIPLAVPGGVLPDDADLPERSGPLAGMLTALRHSHTEWVLVLPCDTPRLPTDLMPRLLAAAQAAQADIAVPVTGDGRHPHWVCALMRKRVAPQLLQAFVNGERKVGRWTQTQAWVGVCFAPETAFQNMNTLETLHDRD